ncbi:hypothetical protein [Microbacterium sp. Root53]|uniref:hypothetical protein n=1 Tax=Microbacterium sp. Root53 TaxID=1736553 RepID=UPI000A5E64FD|nr:hypothetical protein [Microbacterium sp. Root53]
MTQHQARKPGIYVGGRTISDIRSTLYVGTETGAGEATIGDLLPLLDADELSIYEDDGT